jgi:hypothetical protein
MVAPAKLAGSARPSGRGVFTPGEPVEPFSVDRSEEGVRSIALLRSADWMRTGSFCLLDDFLTNFNDCNG